MGPELCPPLAKSAILESFILDGPSPVGLVEKFDPKHVGIPVFVVGLQGLDKISQFIHMHGQQDMKKNRQRNCFSLGSKT